MTISLSEFVQKYIHNLRLQLSDFLSHKLFPFEEKKKKMKIWLGVTREWKRGNHGNLPLVSVEMKRGTRGTGDNKNNLNYSVDYIY